MTFKQVVLSSFRNHGDLLNVAWLNNEACCDFYMGRPTSAGILFQKAAQEFDKYYKRDQGNKLTNKLINFVAQFSRIICVRTIYYDFNILQLNFPSTPSNIQ